MADDDNGTNTIELGIRCFRLRVENDELRAQLERTEAALRDIAGRHEAEDTGEGFTRGGGMAWAMARVAREALAALGAAGEKEQHP